MKSFTFSTNISRQVFPPQSFPNSFNITHGHEKEYLLINTHISIARTWYHPVDMPNCVCQYMYSSRSLVCLYVFF